MPYKQYSERDAELEVCNKGNAYCCFEWVERTLVTVGHGCGSKGLGNTAKAQVFMAAKVNKHAFISPECQCLGDRVG